jgi:hypothetical protein
LFFNDEPSSLKLYDQNLLAKSLFLFLIPYSTQIPTTSTEKLKLFVSFSLLQLPLTTNRRETQKPVTRKKHNSLSLSHLLTHKKAHQNSATIL